MSEHSKETSISKELPAAQSSPLETEANEELHTISAVGAEQLSLLMIVISCIGLAFGGWWLLAGQIDTAEIQRQTFIGFRKHSKPKTSPPKQQQSTRSPASHPSVQRHRRSKVQPIFRTKPSSTSKPHPTSVPYPR